MRHHTQIRLWTSEEADITDVGQIIRDRTILLAAGFSTRIINLRQWR